MDGGYVRRRLVTDMKTRRYLVTLAPKDNIEERLTTIEFEENAIKALQKAEEENPNCIGIEAIINE